MTSDLLDPKQTKTKTPFVVGSLKTWEGGSILGWGGQFHDQPVTVLTSVSLDHMHKGW